MTFGILFLVLAIASFAAAIWPDRTYWLILRGTSKSVAPTPDDLRRTRVYGVVIGFGASVAAVLNWVLNMPAGRPT